MSDVPSIYFIAPSAENVQRLAEDCAARLYESFHINFCSALPQTLMEDLAAKTLRTESTHLIRSVHEQFLDYIGLEHTLFSLNMKGSLVSCYHQRLTDEEAAKNVELVAERLFGVLVTMVGRRLMGEGERHAPDRSWRVGCHSHSTMPSWWNG